MSRTPTLARKLRTLRRLGQEPMQGPQFSKLSNSATQLTARSRAHTVSKEIVETRLMDFPGVRYHSKFRLMTWHPMGIFDRALADKLRECIEWEEHVQNAPFDRYADLSGVTQVEISQQSLVEIASRRHRVLQPVKSAFFADKRHTFLIARIYESLMEDAVAITVRAFHERELAAHWLGVPLAILCPPADGPCE